MATACRSAPNKLCLLCVQLQPIAGRPTRDLDDALRHVGLERAGIRRWGRAVNLGVICLQMSADDTHMQMIYETTDKLEMAVHRRSAGRDRRCTTQKAAARGRSPAAPQT